MIASITVSGSAFCEEGGVVAQSQRQLRLLAHESVHVLIDEDMFHREHDSRLPVGIDDHAFTVPPSLAEPRLLSVMAFVPTSRPPETWAF